MCRFHENEHEHSYHAVLEASNQETSIHRLIHHYTVTSFTTFGRFASSNHNGTTFVSVWCECVRHV